MAACPNCGTNHRSLTLDECRDRDVSEAKLQISVIAKAKRRGFTVAHVGKGIAAYDADGNPVFLTPMSPGWPDLVLAKPGHRLIFIELKSQRGVVSDEQVAWLHLLNQTGNYAIVIRPSQNRDGTVKRILAEGAPLAA